MAKGYLPNLAFQPYIAPQQEVPLEDIEKVGTVLNQRYDQNMAKWDELDAYINQVQLSEADNGIKSSLVKDTRDVLKNIRENGNWEGGRMQVREVAKRLANDQALMMGQQNFKKMQEQKDIEDKMRMQGINLVDFNLDRFNQSTIDPTTGRARVLNYGGTEKLQDYDSKRKSIFEGLQADGYESSSSSPVFNKETGAIYQVGSGSGATYVSAKKIKEIAKNNLNNYIESAEGQQELKMLTTRNSMNANPLTKEEAKKQILNGLVNTGMTRVFQRTSANSSTSIVSLGGGAGSGGAADGILEDDRREELPLEKANTNPIYGSLSDKLDLKVRPKFQSKGTGASGVSLGISGQGQSNVVIMDNKASYGVLGKKEKMAVDNIGIVLGLKKQASGQYSVKDIAKIQNYAKGKTGTASAPTYKSFTETEIEQNNKYVANGNLRSRGFYDIEKDKFVEYNNLPSEVRDALEGKKTGQIQFSGVVDPDNHFYDLATKSKRDKNSDGWLRPEYVSIAGKRFAITSSESEVRKSDVPTMRALNKLTSANRYGVPVRVKGPDGEEFVVQPSSGNRSMYEVRDMNGEVKHTVPLLNLAKMVKDESLKIKEE